MDRKIDKNDRLTMVAVIILLFSALVEWNSYSFLILLAVVLLVAGWYFRK